MLFIAATAPSTAFAQYSDSSDGLSISGEAAVVSDYRFRGVSQNGEEFAIQGGFTVNHDSGFYIGTWGSSIDLPGYKGAEIDAFAGYSTQISSGVTADIGLNAYFYPGVNNSTILEPYGSLSGDLGPASLTVGVAWAPGGQAALADHSSVYVHSNVGVGIPSTPLTLKGHIGYAKSDSGFGGIDGDLLDYSFGVDYVYKALTFGVSYINTDMSNRFGDKEAWSADGAVVFSLGASF